MTAIESRPPLVPRIIRASAGTGKTRELTCRYLQILESGEAPGRILATTFTRKAAAEIQSRVLSWLAAAALGERPAGAPQLTRRAAVRMLATLVKDLHRLSIGTLDSFFMRMAGCFSLELGLPPQWRIVDQAEDERLRGEAVRAVLHEEPPQRVIDLIRLLNPGEVRRSVHDQILSVVNTLHEVFQQTPQREAWEWLDAPSRLPADRLTSAIEALAGLEMALPRKADGTMARAWLSALGNSVEDARKGDWEKFLSRGLAPAVAAGRDTFNRRSIPPELATALRPLITHARGALLGGLASQTRATWELLGAFEERYQRLKQAAGAMRFLDVTRVLARQSIGQRLDDIYYRLDGQISHLLLDEFQDTSLAQWRILEPMADEVVATADRSFFCVGDVKQAIYGWRGGVAEIFDTLLDRWRHIRPQPLDTTWRCRPAVVRTVNRVFSGLKDNAALGKCADAAEKWLAGFAPHSSARQDAPGLVRLMSARKAGEHEQWATTLADAAALVRGIVQRAPGRSIGVLVRRNDAVARVIFELRGLGVAASEEGGNRLTDSPGVGLVLSLLRVADHPGDTTARFHICTSPLGPWLGLVCHDDDAAAERLAARVRCQLVEDGYAKTIYGWARELTGWCDERALRRLMQLVQLAHRYEPQATLRPCDFVRRAGQERVADPLAAEVRVMTLHQAKGLEFDIVVLPELDLRLGSVQRELVLAERQTPVEPPQRIVRYPNGVQREQAPELQQMHEQAVTAKLREELSVLYVMMTRPRYELHMLIAPSKDNERTVSATYAGILRCGLRDDQPVLPQTVLFEDGGEIGPLKEAARPAAPRGAPAAPVLAPADSRRSRTLKRHQPSAHEGARGINVTRVLDLSAAAARQRGVSVHGELQTIEWLEPGGPVPECLKSRAVSQLFLRDSYPADAQVRVRTEEPFLVRLDGRLMSGTIDRLILIEQGGAVVAAEVIDFKTDRAPDAAALAGRLELYRPQIDAYRQAVAQLYGLPIVGVKAKLVFLESGAVCDI